LPQKLISPIACSVFQVHFTISQLAVSGIKVNRLDMYGEVMQVLFITLLVYWSYDHITTLPICRWDNNVWYYCISPADWI